MLKQDITFDQNFEILTADTPQARREVFALRHLVYCEEKGFEACNTARAEYDRHDDHSILTLIRDRSTGNPVGCMRLVLPFLNGKPVTFPLETICGHSLNRARLSELGFCRSKAAEVSRLTIHPAYSPRRADKAPDPGRTSDSGPGRRPLNHHGIHILPALYLSVLAQAGKMGIDQVVLLTEERLAVNIVRMGLKLHPIGPSVIHAGIRRPYFGLVNHSIDRLRPSMVPLWKTIKGNIDNIGTKAVIYDQAI